MFDADVARYEKDRVEMVRLYNEWYHALTLEMQGLAIGLSRPIFREYYKLNHGDNSYAGAYSRNIIESAAIAKNYKNETPETTKKRREQDRAHLNRLRTAMHKAAPGTAARGLAADDFLDEFTYMKSLAFYLDQDWFRELDAIYFIERDVLNEALLDAPTSFDGI